MKILSTLSALSLISTMSFAAHAKAEANELPSEVAFEPSIERLAGMQLVVKNFSNRLACVAIIEAEPLKARGWWTLKNGDTQTFNNIAYVHVEECGQTGVSWNPKWDLQYFCVHATNAFDYYTPDNSSMCSNLGGTMKPYYRIPGGSGTYTWTLNY